MARRVRSLARSERTSNSPRSPARIPANLIQTDGHIAGLDLSAGASLVVRDYDGNPSVPAIVVDQHLATDATGTLRLVFDADPWDSTISFSPGISVTLGGTLDLTFAPGVNVTSQIGRTIDLFDWTGVSPTGAFTISSPYTWNLTNLYTTGEVTLTAAPSLPGDFNHDDAADYAEWRKNPGGIYTPDDYNIWRSHFGQTLGSAAGASASAAVPEPTTVVLVIVGGQFGQCWQCELHTVTIRHQPLPPNNRELHNDLDTRAFFSLVWPSSPKRKRGNCGIVPRWRFGLV